MNYIKNNALKIHFYIMTFLCSSFIYGQNIQFQGPLYIPNSTSFGQIAKDEGYVITNNNDTVFGVVLLLKDDNFITVSLINKITNKSKLYRADKIKKFKVGKSFYESLVLNDSHYFFRRLINGPVSLLDQSDIPKHKSTIVSKDSASTKGTKRKYYLVKNDYLVKVPETFFIKNMVEYFKGCEKLCREIENKKLSFDDMDTIVSEYNEWYISKK